MNSEKKIVVGGTPLKLRIWKLKFPELLEKAKQNPDMMMFISSLIKEQLAYIFAECVADLPTTVLDLHEMGGELCSLRRKEAEVLKKSDQKEEAAKIVANAESRWKTRLLTIFEYLADEIESVLF